MAEYTLKVRRFQPEATEDDKRGAYWDSFDVELDPTLSVLDGLLQARDGEDGTLAVRCSCRAAICGSCGVKINGQSTLACKTQIGEAAEEAERKADGESTISASGKPEIVVEPMGNMPVIKDLVVDMESTHWEKYRRVSPWLMPSGPPPEREYIVPAEAMVDVTQSVACIQCGSCVSACLSMEADPGFIGPAALAKAYRFVGDPRDGQTTERLYDLANDPHGMLVFHLYDAMSQYHRAHPGWIHRYGGASEFRLWIPGMVSGRNPDLAVVLQLDPANAHALVCQEDWLLLLASRPPRGATANRGAASAPASVRAGTRATAKRLRKRRRRLRAATRASPDGRPASQRTPPRRRSSPSPSD